MRDEHELDPCVPLVSFHGFEVSVPSENLYEHFGGTRAETGRVLLIDEETWETAVQRVFRVDSQDGLECSGS